MNFVQSPSILSISLMLGAGLLGVGCSADLAAADAPETAASELAVIIPKGPGSFTIDCAPNVPSKEKLHVEVSPANGELAFSRTGKYPSAGLMQSTSISDVAQLKISTASGAPNTRTFGFKSWSLQAKGPFFNSLTKTEVGDNTFALSIGGNGTLALEGFSSGLNGAKDSFPSDLFVECTIK